MHDSRAYIFMLCFLFFQLEPVFSAGSNDENLELIQDNELPGLYDLHEACKQGYSLNAILIIDTEVRYGIVDQNGVSRSVNRLDIEGKLPIHYAIDRQDTTTLFLLLDQYGADPNYFLDRPDGSRYIEPVLHYALRRGLTRSAALIIHYGKVDLSLLYHGQTPLQMAIDGGYDDLADQIETFLADSNAN